VNVEPADPEVIKVCYQAYMDAGLGIIDPHARWIMNRAWYDRVRATMPPELEIARANAHAVALMAAPPSFPTDCPVCRSGEFADMWSLSEHVAAMADPQNREPAPSDRLFGIPIEVTDDGGAPHLDAPTPLPRRRIIDPR
jgi:hypothetical protein